jgi:hypothetical protein
MSHLQRQKKKKKQEANQVDIFCCEHAHIIIIKKYHRSQQKTKGRHNFFSIAKPTNVYMN